MVSLPSVLGVSAPRGGIGCKIRESSAAAGKSQRQLEWHPCYAAIRLLHGPVILPASH